MSSHSQVRGVPSFFRGCCYTASRGGQYSYAGAAWHLTNSLGSESPEELEELEELVTNDDDEGIWRWFREHYPECMKLVPSRRREQWVVGVKQAAEDGRLRL